MDKPCSVWCEAAAAGLDRICFVTAEANAQSKTILTLALNWKTLLPEPAKNVARYSTSYRDARFLYTAKKCWGLGTPYLPAADCWRRSGGVILADDLCLTENEAGVMSQMTEIYQCANYGVIAIEELPQDQVDRYGVIAGDAITEDLIKVIDMVEKPPVDAAPSNFAIIGRYVLTPDIFDILETLPPGRNGEVQITDALMEQAKAGRVLAYKFKGRRIDCGSVEGFVEATNYCFERSRMGV